MTTRTPSRAPASNAPATATATAAPLGARAPTYAARRAALDAAIAGRRIALPHRAALERSFGRSLVGVPVHCDDAARAALAALDAEAAVYRGHILLATPAPSIRTVAHEVAHLLQGGAESSTPAADITRAPAAAEAEAETLAARAEARTEAHGGVGDPLSFAPLHTEIRLAGGTLALRAARAPALPATPPRPVRVPPATTRALPPVGGGGARGVVGRIGPSADATATPGVAPAEATAAAPASLEGVRPNGAAPVIGAERLAAREAAVDASRARLEAAETATGVVDAFAEAPPTLKAQLAGELGTRLNGTLELESQSIAERTPPVEAHVEHGSAPPQRPVLVAAPPVTPVNLEPAPPAPTASVSAPLVTQPTVPDPNRGLATRATAPTAGNEPRAAVGEALHDVHTANPGIATTAGPTPAIPLAGAADPQRMENQVAAGREHAQQGLEQAHAAVVNGPGAEIAQPISMHVEPQAVEVPLATVDAAPAPAGAEQFLAMNLPPEVQTAFDEGNAERMQGSVAGAQLQMQTAAQQRDQQHAVAVEQAGTERDAAVGDAERDQQAKVAGARRKILDERDATVELQQQAVDDTTRQADDRRTHDREQIDTRVANDRKQIDDKYAKADADAQKEVRVGEEKAEQRRIAAERDAKNESWWDRAVNFVRDAFNALVDAIGTIFDLVRQAVNAVLDVVRDFAIGLINAVTSFISAAIGAFAGFLTTLVDTLLGSIFPELAAELTAAINGVASALQSAVEVVADVLRTAVDAVVGVLRAGINAVIGVFQVAVTLAVGVLYASVTGDWGAVARQAFDAVLSALGIDPAAVYEFIGQAEGTLQTIIDDPGAFLGHVVDAVVSGVGRFAGNFLEHLQAGIIGWLTGAIGGAGLTLPERFDLMGVLSLIQQILGLTWENLRIRVVRLVGEEAVHALEFVAGYVQTLITDGWGALWERIQNDLAALRDTVLEQIRSFLVERILTAAITQLAMMFNPVGALMNLVLTIYNFYTFLRDQMQRIAAVARTVVGAISDIARGVIDPAAQRVEGVLAGLLPLAIDLLARVLRLGNVGGDVRKILEKVQSTIWGAFDRLVERVLASFRSGGAAQGAEEPGAAPGTNLGETIPFDAGTAGSHSLSIQIRGSDAVVILHSEPRLLADVLGQWRRLLNTLEEQRRPRATALISETEGLLSGVDQSADAAVLQAGATPATQDNAEVSIVTGERQIVKRLQELYPMFVVDDSATAKRFERAIGQDQFSQWFPRREWDTFFGIGERQAQNDLAWVRDRSRIDVQDRDGPPQYRLRVSDEDLVASAARLIAGEGRYTALLGSGKRWFGADHIRQFCMRHPLLPNDEARYADAILARIGALLVSRGDVREDDAHYILTAIPSQRTLPNAWKGVRTREQFYIVGSGHGAAAEAVRDARMPDVEEAIMLLKSEKDRALGNKAWTDLGEEQIVPATPFKPELEETYLKRASYDVDHEIPLAEHWSLRDGNNADENSRHIIAAGADNLRLMWAAINRSRGAEGATYIDYVGIDFQSQFTRTRGFQFADSTKRFQEYL